MQYPRIIGIGNRRHNAVSSETRIIRQLVLASPAFKVERRICHYEINFFILVQIFGKRRGILFSETMGNTPYRKIHFTKPPCIRIALLSDNRNIVTVSVMLINKLHRLHKHSAAAAAGIIYHSAVWLYHFSDQLYYTGRSVEFTVFLCPCSSVCLKKILIHSADKVFFLKTLLVDLVYLIYKVLYFRFIGTKSSKQIQRQSAF